MPDVLICFVITAFQFQGPPPVPPPHPPPHLLHRYHGKLQMLRAEEESGGMTVDPRELRGAKIGRNMDEG